MDGSIPVTMPSRNSSPFLSTKQAAAYVGLSPRTLEKMRVVGGGPMYRKHGRYVRYHIDDLSGWSSSNAHSSTSEMPIRSPSPSSAARDNIRPSKPGALSLRRSIEAAHAS